MPNKSTQPSPLLPIIPLVTVREQAQGGIERQKGFRLRQITWVNQGEMWVKIGNEERVLQKGQGFYFDRNVPHSYGNCPKTKLFVSYVVFDGGDDLLEYFGIKDYFFFDISQAIDRKYIGLNEYFRNTELIVLQAAATYKWMAELFATLFSSPKTLSDKVDTYLAKNYSKGITLSDIAEDINIDKYFMCRQYKNEKNKTIMKSLKQVRIKKAKQMLWQTTMSVEEIGLMCGFIDLSYFIKNFKDITGTTPKKYRTNKTMPSQDEYDA